MTDLNKRLAERRMAIDAELNWLRVRGIYSHEPHSPPRVPAGM
jgi:hypothetical protein